MLIMPSTIASRCNVPTFMAKGGELDRGQLIGELISDMPGGPLYWASCMRCATRCRRSVHLWDDYPAAGGLMELWTVRSPTRANALA